MSEEEPKEWLENLVAIVVVSLMILAVYGFFAGWYHQKAPQPQPVEKRFQVTIDDDPMLGNPDAPVTIIEFSDYLCGACRKFQQEVWPRLKATYIDTGKARFVYRDFPLVTLHKNSLKVAAAATCAGEQGKYWQFHDAFYNQSVTEELITKLVATYGLNASAFTACRKRQDPYREAEDDRRDGVLLGQVSASPTFFINGRKLVGNRPFEDFQKVIEEELSARQEPPQ